MTSMIELKTYAIKIRNFKCFEDWQGLDGISPVL